MGMKGDRPLPISHRGYVKVPIYRLEICNRGLQICFFPFASFLRCTASFFYLPDALLGCDV